MIITIFRTILLYALLICIMRIMGKRQIGQLQPGELVITILISEIAAVPMQDNDIPMINSIISVLLLASFEVIISAVSMKSLKIRSALQGNSLIIIRDGKLDQKQLKRLRYTVDDVLEALRQKDVFDIGDVEYAVAETDGTLSILLKPGKRPATAEDVNADISSEGMNYILISDGRIISSGLDDCNMSSEKFRHILKKKNLNPKKVLLMTSDKNGHINIIKRDNGGNQN